MIRVDGGSHGGPRPTVMSVGQCGLVPLALVVVGRRRGLELELNLIWLYAGRSVVWLSFSGRCRAMASGLAKKF